MYKNVKLGQFWINIGWYYGEPFCLFTIGVCGHDPYIFTLFDLQIIKFCFSFGFYL